MFDIKCPCKVNLNTLSSRNQIGMRKPNKIKNLDEFLYTNCLLTATHVSMLNVGRKLKTNTDTCTAISLYVK